MANTSIRQLIKHHGEEGETECRWCFAVDMQRIKGTIIATYNFPDATLVHLSCPRCGGEFTLYFHAWEESYLKDIIATLHPELEERMDNVFDEVNNRVCPELLDIPEGCR